MQTSISDWTGSRLSLTRQGKTAVVRLFNPPHGFMDELMESELTLALDTLEDWKDGRVVVITGATPDMFVRHYDVSILQKRSQAMTERGKSFSVERPVPKSVIHLCIDRIENSPLVFIAALNGTAMGGGFELALGCDIRIAADTAKMAPGFAKRGILPESGGTWLLPRIVGYARAAEIAFTGRTLMADECLELGLVNAVVPADQLMDSVREMAGEIASNAPLAVRAIKRMMRAAETETFEQNVHHVFLQLLPLFRTKDFKEGVAAFIEKRPPRFIGR